MGRLTEMIEFLNVDPKKLASSVVLFTHFYVNDTAKEVRKEYISELKKQIKNDK